MIDLYNKNIYIEINRKYRMEFSELLFFIAYSLYLVKVILETTMFKIYIGKNIDLLINIVVVVLLIMKIIFCEKYSPKIFITASIFSILALLIYKQSSYANIIFLILFIIGAKNVEFIKIVKCFLIIKLIITCLAIIGANLGVIEHIIYIRDGKIRNSFGSIYATDFAAGIFFILIGYSYIRYEKFSIKESIIYIFIGYILLELCDTRLDSLCIIGLAFIMLIRKSIEKNKIWRKIILISIPISAIISIELSKGYDVNNKLMLFLNKALSGRLRLGKQGIDEYGFKPFGQTVEMIGNGGRNIPPTNYFFIDSSYLHIALRYGVIILILICGLLVYKINKNIKNGDIALGIIIMIIAINSIVAHHLIDLAYNPFILILFSKNYRIYDKKEVII